MKLYASTSYELLIVSKVQYWKKKVWRFGHLADDMLLCKPILIAYFDTNCETVEVSFYIFLCILQ